MSKEKVLDYILYSILFLWITVIIGSFGLDTYDYYKKRQKVKSFKAGDCINWDHEFSDIDPLYHRIVKIGNTRYLYYLSRLKKLHISDLWDLKYYKKVDSKYCEKEGF